MQCCDCDAHAGRPLREWGASLMDDVLPRALEYIVSQGRDVDDNKLAWFVSANF